MTIDEIRRHNLSALAAESGGIGRLAERIGKDPSQLSQWINASPDSRTGRPRGIRSITCRAIEKMTGKPIGWLEAQHGMASATAASPPWPFESIDAARYGQLPDRLKGVIEGRVMAMIEEWESSTRLENKN